MYLRYVALGCSDHVTHHSCPPGSKGVKGPTGGQDTMRHQRLLIMMVSIGFVEDIFCPIQFTEHVKLKKLPLNGSFQSLYPAESTDQ